jgi:stalled ribosome rescue protein Dom34
MNRDVVLLDTQHARIFRLGTDAKAENLRLSQPNHHTHRQTHEDRESPKFYAEVAEHLRDADELLVLGHGVATTHFKTFLEQHQPQLAKKVVGYETVDQPTDGQLAALATRYFHRVEKTRQERGE